MYHTMSQIISHFNFSTYIGAVWFAAVASLARCGAAEAFPVCPWLATLATTTTPKVRRRIPAPQLWRVFVLGAVVAATPLTATKHQPQSVAWRTRHRTKHQPSSPWLPQVWRGGRRWATKQPLPPVDDSYGHLNENRS